MVKPTKVSRILYHKFYFILLSYLVFVQAYNEFRSQQIVSTGEEKKATSSKSKLVIRKFYFHFVRKYKIYGSYNEKSNMFSSIKESNS